MSVSESHFDGLMEIDRDDILAAMQKLTKMIQSDKQFDISEIQQPKQHFASSPHINSVSRQKPSYTQHNNTYQYDNNDLIEGLKSVAHELSRYEDNSQVLNESVSPSGIPSNRHHQQMMTEKSSKYTTAEKSHKTDRYANTVNRLHELDSRKREKIAAKQFQQYKQELSALRSKPQISLNSRIIAEQKRSVPIYERTQMIMKQKEENINKLRRELEARREDRDLSPTFQPDLSFTKRHNYEKTRTLKEFTSQMYAWQHRKNETIQKEQYENIARELSELTFKPQINNKSRSIASKVNQNVPVENRLQKHKDQVEEKRKERLEKDKPAFKPILNERSMNLANSKKNLARKSYRHDRSANLSFTDISRDEGRSRSPIAQSRSPGVQSRSPVGKNNKGPAMHGRSLTPTKATTKTMYRDRSPEFNQISPKFNEVNYSPAVDFLLRKLGK